MQNIVIFSSHLLPKSQTFIKSLGDKLKQFNPFYVGMRFVNGLALPAEKLILLNEGGLKGHACEGLFKLFQIAPQFERKVKRIHPVLIHAQFGLSGVLALPLAQKFNLPLLVHYRGADATLKGQHVAYSSLNHWIYFQRLALLKRETRLFMTVSKFLKNVLIEQGFPGDKILVHYQGVDVHQFNPSHLIEREPIVLFVGRLTEKKGCEYLLRSFAEVEKQLPHSKLVVIGDGPLRQGLEQLAQKSIRNVQFVGFQDHAAVKQWMNRACLLAVPSITTAEGETEGLPNVVMEALAMGLPVVGTLHAGIPEVITDGVNGFLVPERSLSALTKAMLCLMSNQDLWRQFSCSGRQVVEHQFNRDQQTRILEDIYASVLSSSSSDLA